jgi:GR25 family glycosyltransferase involved in LPS biosynthesis
MFNKVLYINLDRRQDRNQNVINELNKANINNVVQRIPGVDWKTLDFNNLSNELFTQTAIATALDNNQSLYVPITKGGIGVALAHRNVYLNVLESNEEYVLILEDDIHMINNFTEKLNEYLKEIPNFDILFIGFHQITFDNNVNKNNRDKCYLIPTNVWGLFGYIINKKAASELLKIFPLTYQIDTEISKSFPHLNVYCLQYNNRIIYSEGSAPDTEFGTDVQIREDFYNYESNSFNINKKLLFYILFIIIIIYLIYNYNSTIKTILFK